MSNFSLSNYGLISQLMRYISTLKKNLNEFLLTLVTSLPFENLSVFPFYKIYLLGIKLWFCVSLLLLCDLPLGVCIPHHHQSWQNQWAQRSTPSNAYTEGVLFEYFFEIKLWFCVSLLLLCDLQLGVCTPHHHQSWQNQWALRSTLSNACTEGALHAQAENKKKTWTLTLIPPLQISVSVPALEYIFGLNTFFEIKRWFCVLATIVWPTAGRLHTSSSPILAKSMSTEKYSVKCLHWGRTPCSSWKKTNKQ